MAQHTHLVTQVKMRKKGQITLPKKIRDEDDMNENDTFVLTHTSNGDTILRRVVKRMQEDRIFDIIKTHKPINWREAWEEVRAERRQGDL